MIAKKALNTLLAGAVALTVAGMAQNADAQTEKEKCYGVARAGANDCAAANGSHSCAAQAAADRDGNEWVAVPKGLCEKLAGGSVTPVGASPGPATAPTEAEENHEH